jgi:hypothetical protein
VNVVGDVSPLKGSVKTGLALSALLILSNYYYFYFYSFNEGNVEGGGGFALLKIVALFLFYFLILSPFLKKSFGVETILFILFLLFSICTLFLKRAVWESGDLKYLNTVICAAPFFVLRMNKDFKRIFFFLDMCVVILVGQVFIDIVVFLCDYSLWRNKAFVGGLGNPSCFGFICNLLISYILFYKRATLFTVFSLCVLSFAVVMTNSMLSVFMLVVIFFLWGAVRGICYLLSCAVVGAALAVVGHTNLLVKHLIYKISSLYGLFAGATGDFSSSVLLRVDIHHLFFEQLSENFFGVLFFGYPDRYYYFADSQFLTYFGSFGIMASLLFFGAMVLSGLTAYSLRSRFGLFSMVAIAMFMLTFCFNRILDYYPVALFLFLICASVRHARTA